MRRAYGREGQTRPKGPSLRTRRGCLPIALALLAVSGCTDAVPTSDDGDRIPVQAETVEVRLSFSSFARDLQSFSGFGSPADLPVPIVANQWAGELESRLLVRFAPLPEVINVLPPGATTGAEPDSTFQPVSARVVLRMDTLDVGSEPFDFSADAILSPWHPETASWEVAVDTLGGVTEWPEPGGGPVRPLGSVTWLPEMADSVMFEIDSLTVAEWAEADRPDRGLRVSGTTVGSRLRVASVGYDVRVRSEINPDSLILVSPGEDGATVVYSPTPETSDDVLLIGGAPARRATFRVELPASVQPSAEVCARIDCPLEIRAERILFAGFALHSHPTLSPGLAPLDSVRVQLRSVLSPDRLPRSPLSVPVSAGIERLPPELFSAQTETLHEIPMTAYVRSLLGADSSEVGVLSTLALLSDPEARSLEVVSFYAPGTVLEPYMRLILTVSDGVSLP